MTRPYRISEADRRRLSDEMNSHWADPEFKARMTQVNADAESCSQGGGGF
jgi:hypothetical protein